MSEHITHQLKRWQGKFGREYTDRNVLAPQEMNNLYLKNYGINRTALNEMFIEDFDRSFRILEVGANVGNQLIVLQQMGFENLYGIEINSYANKIARANTKNINIISGSAFDIPFEDKCFDMVFTSGVLIHIAPSDIRMALQEIHRVTKEYIWGFEYYADKYTEVMYRGHKELLWKANFAGLYLEMFDDLELVKEKHVKYLENDNVDVMFLLRKRKTK
jgi:pseudaminic acid biosynthesis-associated methylase